MQDTSDQTEYEESTDVELDPQETEEDQTDDVEETEEEEVKPKKAGYVEFDTPEQKARVAQLSREKHDNERKFKLEKAEREKLARELEELKRPAAPKEVPVPSADPVTEPEVFARQQRERDTYIRESTKYETETNARQEAKQQSEAQRKTALVEGYVSNMERLKLNPQILAKAAKTCADYGINDDHPLIEDLLEDKDGPAIVKYLADHPEHLSEVASLKPTKALAYIEREIRANLNVKKQSKAPPPPTKANGTRTASTSESGWSIS